MSKKYRYIRLENISNFEGWDLVEIIPAKSNEYYDMCVMCLDDAPLQRDEEIEMLKSYKSLYEDLKAENLETIKAINKCKAEAIREFVNLFYDECLEVALTDDALTILVNRQDFENLVREMTEERK